MHQSESSQVNLWLLYIAVAIDILAVGLVLPLLPYYASSLGADAWQYGLLGTTYGLAQLIGGPFMGKMSDTHGRRVVFLVSFAGTGVSYFLMATANSLWMLFVSRIPVGLVKQTMSVSKAYISDVSDPSIRARQFGFLSVAASTGFIVGPTLGGYLSALGQHVPAFIASLLFFVNLIFVYFLLPESSTHHVHNVHANKPQKQSASLKSTIQSIQKVLHMPIVGELLIIHFFVQFSLGLFRSNFAIYSKDRFDLDPKSNGLILSYAGLLDVFTQSFVIGYLTRRHAEYKLILASVIGSSLALAGFAFSYDLTLFILWLIPFALSSSITTTCISSSITKAVKKEEVGMTLGVSDALESLGRVITPTLGGFLMNFMGTSGAPLIGSCMSALLTIFIYTRLIQHVSIQKQD